MSSPLISVSVRATEMWLGLFIGKGFNPLNAELNPICHLLALLEGATIVDVSELMVKVPIACV